MRRLRPAWATELESVSERENRKKKALESRSCLSSSLGPQGHITVNGPISEAKPGRQSVLLAESRLCSAALPASAKCALRPASWREEWGICFCMKFKEEAESWGQARLVQELATARSSLTLCLHLGLSLHQLPPLSFLLLPSLSFFSCSLFFPSLSPHLSLFPAFPSLKPSSHKPKGSVGQTEVGVGTVVPGFRLLPSNPEQLWTN